MEQVCQISEPLLCSFAFSGLIHGSPFAFSSLQNRRTLTKNKARGASQAMLYATGLSERDMSKPQVGIASVWFEGNPCNMHLLDLSEKVKRAVETNNLVAYRFNTVGVSDAISMGTSGMRYSLQSREVIADSIETLMCAQWYDGLITLPGCDKNMPGCVIAMARLNRPAIMIYGGTIRGGKHPQTGEPLNIVDALESYGAYVYDKISDEERQVIIRHACPGPGACGGMYTANTMATAIEALGTCKSLFRVNTLLLLYSKLPGVCRSISAVLFLFTGGFQ